MKKLTFVLTLILVYAFSMNAQTEFKIIEQPTIRDMNFQKAEDLSDIAFRMYFVPIYIDQRYTSIQLGIDFDLGKNIDGQIFIAPRDGIYHFDAKLNFRAYNHDQYNWANWHLRLFNGKNIIEQMDLTNPASQFSAKHSLIVITTVLLHKGDKIYILYEGQGNDGTIAQIEDGSFSGFLVSELPKVEKTIIK